MSFTPGPWEQTALLSGSENDKGFRVTAFDGRDGRVWIADVSPVIDNDRGDASEEGKANARLIVAAPEMYAACRALVEHLGEMHTCRQGRPDDDCKACLAFEGSGVVDALAKANVRAEAEEREEEGEGR